MGEGFLPEVVLERSNERLLGEPQEEKTEASIAS